MIDERTIAFADFRGNALRRVYNLPFLSRPAPGGKFSGVVPGTAQSSPEPSHVGSMKFY